MRARRAGRAGDELLPETRWTSWVVVATWLFVAGLVVPSLAVVGLYRAMET